jgi:DNA-binding NarL/FixJ family response regulator
MRRLLAMQLAQMDGFEVVGEACDGREAIDMVDRLRPDIVLMDLSMPGMNGVKAIERLAGSHPYVKTILLTGHEDLASLGRQAGATEFLNKDCTPETLAATILRAHESRSHQNNGKASLGQVAAIERLSTRAKLSENEKIIFERVVTTDLTIQQIATAISEERAEPVSNSAVKHTLERVMTKLRMETRTRPALVKMVFEFDENRPQQKDGEDLDY